MFSLGYYSWASSPFVFVRRSTIWTCRSCGGFEVERMILLTPLLIALLGAFVVLSFRNPRVATRVALLIGGLEIASLVVIVWQVHRSEEHTSELQSLRH